MSDSHPGKPGHKLKLNKVQIRRLLKLRQEGRTYKEIGQRFGVAPETAKNYVTGVEAGIYDVS